MSFVSDRITLDLHLLYDECDADIITPMSLALPLLGRYQTSLDDRVRYLSLQHLQQMARHVLRTRVGHDATPEEEAQGDFGFFNGKLQERYPLPPRKGEPPAYKLREKLTDGEIDYNISLLRKSGQSRLAHADALEAWKRHRAEAA